ncbi:DUF453-domain-containing protein [Polychaeton citri CBS 116435]|uniref:DUF453-domain-containing protein n=1 Tax=Polychaeton citri CBS 116435 TaxID=1314669 RepID=A0A9P4URW0_9PEZI|nr:DUF453-domain-containing protein [Polychaeton citri CBS 116435]
MSPPKWFGRGWTLPHGSQLCRRDCIPRPVKAAGLNLLQRPVATRTTPPPQPTRSSRTPLSFPATFVRGGTSNGLVITRSCLPPATTAQDEVAQWQPILSSAMGSPDPTGRQLDGLGSGISSTSKVCVIEPSSRPDVDVEYTFVQVGIRDGRLDAAGNCGNMSSAVGPVALEEGLVPPGCVVEGGEGTGLVAKVRMLNRNTAKLIEATFDVEVGEGSGRARYQPAGAYAIDGVPGTGSRIMLSFLDPAGSKTGRALPTGNGVDELRLPDGSSVQASLVDVANPGVFVLAKDVGLRGEERPETIEAESALMERLEEIRRAGATAMELNPDVQSIPKIVMLSPPSERLREQGVNIVCRALSMQQAHKAAPLTLALNLGAACRMPGTLPAMAAVDAEGKESVVIAHASGKLEVGSVMQDGQIKRALLHRTARVMMKGEVSYSLKS